MRAVLVVLTVVVGALAATIAYLLYGYFSLSYALDRQALTIRWGWSRTTIPLAAVERVGPALQMLGARRAGASLPWPGYYLEAFPLPDGVSVRTFATQPLHRQVVVCTADTLYALSPERPVRFMEELVRLRERVAPASLHTEGGGALAASGPIPALMQATEQLPIMAPGTAGQRRPRSAARPKPAGAVDAVAGRGVAAPGRRLTSPPGLMHDRLAQGLLVGAITLNVSMFGYLFWRLPMLPDRIPLHFNALGQVDRIGQPVEILWLPGIVLGTVIVNTLLGLSIQRYDAFAARLLLAGPIITGFVAWVAVVNLV